MTTVSVVECISPISLRTCGSSVSSLAHSRRTLHGTSPTKRAACMKTSSPDFRDVCSPFQPRDIARDLGLEKALTSSPLQSPIPRTTPSTLGSFSRNTIRRTPSVSSLECSDEEINDEIWRQPSPDSPDNLFVVGSKPRLHGMWQVPDLGPVTPSKVQQAVYPTREDCYDYCESPREAAISPDNPPPSPINFRPDMTGVVVGGQKMSYPERSLNTSDSSRDFNPGLVKKPLHHCLKCEGRVVEEELTQVTLHKRLSSILNNHMMQKLRHDEALMKSNSMRDFRDRTESCDGHVNNLSRDSEQAHAQQSKSANISRTRSKDFAEAYENGMSFCEVYALRKREKIDREREAKEMREQRIENKRVEEIKRLKEKIASKNERSQRVLSNFKEKMSSTSLYSKVHRNNIEAGREMTKSDRKVIPPTLLDITNHQPADTSDSVSPINTLEQATEEPKKPDVNELTGTEEEHAEPEVNELTGDEEERLHKLANYVIKKSWSDVFPRQKSQVGEVKPFKVERHGTQGTDCMANAVMIGQPAPIVLNSKLNVGNMDDKPRDQQTTFESKPSVPDRESPETLEPLTPVPSASNDRLNEDQSQEITMSATVIVPQRDIPCTQWITFNGDNEPVINNGPDKEDGCDTFLKRLQKSKICNQNDPSLPSGQQFCFEAMVDKRYNRWKRRRRKKQSEARRVSVIQSSDSSDDNDERDGAMERIIDKMYEQIHGPVPRTPNGSRETPRVRNRRRRKETSDGSATMTENTEQEPTLRYYDASSEWTSDGCHMSSSSACHFGNLEMTQDDKKVLSSAHTDDLCSWPYLEQYKSEILKRLQNTPPEPPESFDRNDWLPSLENPSCDSPEAKNAMTPEVDDNMAGIPETSVKEKESSSVNNNIANTLDCGFQIDRNQENEKYVLDRAHTDEKQHGWLPEIDNNIPDRPETEVEFTLDGNEDTICDNGFDSEDAMDDFEPFIRVDGTPRHSPESPKKCLTETASFPELQYTLDPENQGYSYKRWSRSQRSTPSKMSTQDLKPRLLSRMSASTWSDVGSETADCVSVVAVGDRQRKCSSVKPVNKQDVGHGIRDERRLFKRSQKIAMPIKKQNVNVNLPSLTRNSRSQTVPYTGGKHSESRPLKSTKSSQRLQSHTPAETRRSRNLPSQTDNKGQAPGSAPGTSKDSQPMPDFLFRDYYLRSLYGNKVRMNSHIESTLKKTRVRRTITVDNLDIKVKKIKKKPDDNKPRDSSFTRSFTFSMFDLPQMYRIHNNNLERRANGEDIDAYE